MTGEHLSFGPFRLDLGRRQLLRNGDAIRVGSRAIDILCVLVAAKGEVVSKERLMAEVWPDLTVADNNLQVHISALRRALADSNGVRDYIVTVPGRGYRLVGLQAPPAVEKRSRSLPVPDRPSIAVLPFQNMSDDPSQEYFADGMAEEITTALSRCKGLFVIARNSAFTYKGKAVDVRQVGRDLGVRYVLEGSVRKAKDRVRMTGQLIETETGTHLWAERYDRSLEDIFAVQDELSLSLIGALEPALRKAETNRVKRKRPDSLDAYDLVLRALPLVYSMMAKDASLAILPLKKAVELEPGYALAHAFLAWCFHFRFNRGGLKEEDRTASLHHARAAVTCGSDDATALAIAGLVIWFDEHDIQMAQNLFERALALSSSNVFALCCSAIALAWMGNAQLAIERAQRALRFSPFDPLNYVANDALAISYMQTNQHDKALNAARLAVESNPGFSNPHALLAAALVRLGRLDEAKVAARQVLVVDPTFTVRRCSVTLGCVVPAVFTPIANAWLAAGLPEK